MNTLNIEKIGTGLLKNGIDRHSTEDIKKMILQAKKVQPEWEGLSVKERAAFLVKIRECILSRADEIAEIIASDCSKTRVDAMATEVLPSMMAISYYLKKSKKWMKDKKIQAGNIFFINKRSKIHRVPYGVIGVITPWNYPFTIPFSEVVMGLIAGNCVILKVAEETANVGKILKEVIESAELPVGVFNYVECNGPDTSKTMFESGIDKIFFTGSVRVGKLLMEKASETLTPVNLELGGNDAMIVCSDANLDRASAGAAWAGFQTAGQSCGGVERIYVHESVYEEFVEKLCGITKKLRVGLDEDFSTDIGSVTTLRQAKTIWSHVASALENGAEIAAESKKINKDNSGKQVPPIVLVKVNHDMTIMREETFGPVVGVMKFRDIEEAINLANDSELGLTASVWSSDKKKAEKIGKQIKAGVVNINDHLMSHGLAETPWGGFKNSGMGRSHGEIGFNEMTQPQVIINDYLAFLPKNIWWFPFSKSLYEGIKGIGIILYSQSLKKKAAAMLCILKILPRTLVKYK